MPSSQTKALGWSLARWSMACISGGRWLRAGRQCRRMHHEARSTAATRLRREYGAGGGVSWVAFTNTRWTMRCGIVFSPACAHIGAPRPVKELLRTTGGLHHTITVILRCQMSGKQGISGVERLGKALETVAATVDQFAGPLEVLL
jgi:hypothetical protein